MPKTADLQIWKARFLGLLRVIQMTRPGVGSLIEYLKHEGFFLELASKRYHNDFPGGLLKHSLDVYDLFKDKVIQYKLKVPEESIILASLFHDLCKLNIYKTDNDGELITDDPFPSGHGEKSIFMLQRFIQLGDQEMMLIRWHMGLFEAGEPRSYTRQAWRQAIKKYPEIIAFHCADWEAATYLTGEKYRTVKNAPIVLGDIE